jgi:hypothetical protein
MQLLKKNQLTVGSYDLIYFLNDSYQQYGKLGQLNIYDKGEDIDILSNISFYDYEKENIALVRNRYHVHNTTDWVGIFTKDDLHTRENLIAWAYIPGIGHSINLTILDESLLTLGQYDIVYFTQDSYEQFGKIAILTIKEPLHNIDPIVSVAYNSATKLVTVQHRNMRKFDIYTYTNWIGVFKKDAERINTNLIAWAYSNRPYQNNIFSLQLSTIRPELFVSGEYDVVYLLDDTYEQYGETKMFIIP